MQYTKMVLWLLGLVWATHVGAVTNEEIFQSMAGKYLLIPGSIKVIGYSSKDKNLKNECRPQLTIDVRQLNQYERGLRIYDHGDGETGGFYEYSIWDLKTTNPLSFQDRSGGVLHHWNLKKTDIGIEWAIMVMSDEGSVEAQAICQYKRIE